MAWGTLVLIVATYTPVFNWLAYPFYYLLELVKMPEAYDTAPAFVLAFADQFLAAVIGAARTAPAAKFMCAGISITGLIYMTEIGVLILDSKIPLDFKDLLIIYIERAVLTIFLLVPFAYWLT
jgi:nucleoside recognition membrane protein YjiH